ncbi:hypothetical protein ACFL6S_21450, partial [Candidatus Poribacteria bacterium]
LVSRGTGYLSNDSRPLGKNEVPDKIIEVIEGIPFEEWMSLVQYAINNHPMEAGDFLWFVAQHHYDDGWRSNALQELITTDLVQRFDIEEIFELERDPEILDMLYEYGYS